MYRKSARQIGRVGGMLWWVLALFAVHSLPAAGRKLEVGPGKALKTISQAAAEARPGDTVLIYPGVYREAVRWKGGKLDGDPITVRGVGPVPPLIDGLGLDLSGSGPTLRGLFQIEGNNFIFEN